MNQDKLEMVKQDMERVNINFLGISELKWTGMGELNSDDHYIYYCGQESLWRDGVAIIINKSSKCSAAAAKSLQSCLTLCDPIDGSPPGSALPGILQARTLEWVAISFSSAWKWKVKVKSFSHARLLATPWTAAYQAPPSMGFSRQEHWSGVPLYLDAISKKTEWSLCFQEFNLWCCVYKVTTSPHHTLPPRNLLLTPIFF